MRAIIVGNGLAGTMAAKTLRELDSGLEIEVFAEEAYPYYPRPNLIEFLAGALPPERLFAFPENWDVRQDIHIRLAQAVARLEPKARTVETRDGRSIPYDVLLLACGSRSSIPPIPGAGKKGVFNLRTLDDARGILDYLTGHPRVAVLGGGLLGLEVARALKARGAGVTVAEVFDRLLPRQLDVAGAALLRRQFEKLGIPVRLGVQTSEILGGDEAAGLRFKSGDDLPAEMVIVAAGVKPEIGLAQEAGLAVERGVVANDFLQTSDDRIFVAGDAAQHNGRVYGIIPAAFDQARIAAWNMLNPEKTYRGTVPFNTLKVAGLSVTSIGVFAPEGQGFEVIVGERPDEGIYKKLVFRGGAIVGAVWMGTKKGIVEISRLAAGGTNVDKWKNALLDDDFDFSVFD